MNTSVHTPAHPLAPATHSRVAGLIGVCIDAMARIPHSMIALIGRFAIAGVFWKSGQTKVEGLVIDIVEGNFQLGWPQLSDTAVSLFSEEYQLPLIPPELGAVMAATGEHVLPLLLLIGLGTRFAALGLLVMTAVIQLLVYPSAWPVHGAWAAVLLWLMSRGPGTISVDHWLARRTQAR